MKYLIWGTGLRAEELYKSCYEKIRKRDIEIVGFLDNNWSGKRPYFHDIKVYKPSDINQLDYDYIDIWVVNGKEEIRKQIENDLHIPDTKLKRIYSEYIDKLLIEYRSEMSESEVKGYELPSLELLSAYVDFYGAQQWYKYAYKEFESRTHVFKPYEWIRKNVSKESEILEVACGVGGMLYRLQKDGFQNLTGYDVDGKAIGAAKDIDNVMGGKISFYIDNAVHPMQEGKYDVIVWVNGMYHLVNYKLEDFFDNHIKMLRKGGYIVFDMVDIKYNEVPQNEYRTDCWNKAGKKEPTEYKLRMSEEEVIMTGEKYHVKLIEKYDANATVPRKVYIFKG